VVLLEGIELSTSPLPRECSTTELQQRAKARGGFIGWRAPARNPAVIDTIAVTSQIRRVNDPAKPEPRLTPAAARARAEREARQAEALRANLRRRKVQARGRDSQQEDGPKNPLHSLYPDISE
jgi:hypothetical protein